MSKIRLFTGIFLSLAFLIIGGCTAITPDGEADTSEKPVLGGSGDPANGERIYFTGTSDNGTRITYRGGPDFGGMMMGNYLTCAACHGPQAGGGEHVMHMWLMDAPDITYEALMGEAGEHAETGESIDEHGDYTVDDFRLAVVEGKHPDGDFLTEDMPRWQMENDDLRDLLAFLKSLSE